MCIAFYAPPKTTIDRDTLRRCFEANPHGAGFIIPTPNGPKVKKGFFDFKSWADAISHNLRRNKHGVIGHCRIATHGNIDVVNCHPHSIESHGAAFVHNGIIGQHCVKDSKFSDSILFGKEILEELPQNWNELDGVKAKIETYIGKYNKIIYVFKNGIVEILNKSSGVESEGVWYSNDSFMERSEFEYFTDFGFCNQCYLELEEEERIACDDLCLGDLVCLRCAPYEIKTEYEQLVFESNFENQWEKYENEYR